MAVTAEYALELLQALDADLRPDGRLGLVRRYMDGDHDKPYAPRGAKKEYIQLQERAITNHFPSLVDSVALSLIVCGYRPSDSLDNSKAWDSWQANGFDAQSIEAHRWAVAYGTCYVLVTPSTVPGRAFMKVLDPTKSLALYAEDHDDFPTIGLHVAGVSNDGGRLVDVWDATDRTRFHEVKSEDSGVTLTQVESAPHPMGVVPFGRLREHAGGASFGIVHAAKPVQDRLNEITFAALVAMQFASFRQRWATGLAIPEDENGNPVEPFQAAVDRLWVSDDPNAKFGEFGQTSLSDHLAFMDRTRDALASIVGVNPGLLAGMSVDHATGRAVGVATSLHAAKIRALQATMGESWAAVFRLVSRAIGDTKGADDVTAQTRWADVEADAFQSTMQGLHILTESLAVPAQALWEKVPGATEDDLVLWRRMAREADPIESLANAFARQDEPAEMPTSDGAIPAADLKAKADAMGVLIRSGVDPVSAASRVGLDGVKFTGAVPVSLRLPETDAVTLEGA